jgi:hypothetical protein
MPKYCAESKHYYETFKAPSIEDAKRICSDKEGTGWGGSLNKKEMGRWELIEKIVRQKKKYARIDALNTWKGVHLHATNPLQPNQTPWQSSNAVTGYCCGFLMR